MKYLVLVLLVLAVPALVFCQATARGGGVSVTMSGSGSPLGSVTFSGTTGSTQLGTPTLGGTVSYTDPCTGQVASQQLSQSVARSYNQGIATFQWQIVICGVYYRAWIVIGTSDGPGGTISPYPGNNPSTTPLSPVVKLQS